MGIPWQIIIFFFMSLKLLELMLFLKKNDFGPEASLCRTVQGEMGTKVREWTRTLDAAVCAMVYSHHAMAFFPVHISLKTCGSYTQ